MADFAIYSALSGRRDWSQVRADRQNELIYLKQMQNDLQNRIQTEAQARAGVVEYMQQINQATVLEGDLERIKAVESDARKKIVEGLKAAGNDYNKFLLGNGAAELQNYYNTVMQSDAMKDAVNNKVNAAQYALDTYMGRQARPVSITMPDGTQKSISFEDQMKMYESGQLNRINYAGSVKPVQLVEIQDAIQKTFGKNPYSRQKASKEDIYEYAQRFGAEDWQAEQLANQYEAGMIQGTETPIYFNYKEPKAASASSISKAMNRYGSSDLNLLQNLLNGKFSDKTKIRQQGEGEKGQFAVFEYETDLSSIPEIRNNIFAMSRINSQVDKDTNETKYFYDGYGYGAKRETKLDLSNADIIPETAKLVTIAKMSEGSDVPQPVQFGGSQYTTNPISNGIPFLKVDVAYDNLFDATRSGAFDSWLSEGEREYGNFVKKDGEWIGSVYIPIDDSFKSQIFNRPKQDAQTEFEDILDYQTIETLRAIDESGYNIDEFFTK